MKQLCLFSLLLATSAAAQEPEFHDMTVLERQVLATLGANIGDPGGPAVPLDRRLKLAVCPEPVAIDPPAMGAVALHCRTLGWRIRVPLTLAQRSEQTSAYTRGAIQSAAQPVIRRGDQVELEAVTNGFRVSTLAVALEDGAIGRRIRLKSEGKATPVFAEVVDNGLARLPGFK
jgi:flagellar basal body P-ring formation protein FlgA